MDAPAARRARRIAAWIMAFTAVAAGSARAADDGADPQRQEVKADRSAAAGAFAPWTMSARSDTQSAVVQVRGGYDSALGGPLFESLAEGRVSRRLSILAGSTYAGSASKLRPQLGLKVDVLRQEHQGLDLAMAASYQGLSFNMVPAAAFTAALGRTVGNYRLCANLAYAQGMELDERHGDMRLGAFRRVARNVHVGFDSRLRVDLERDASEPAGEPEWDLVAAPEVGYTFGNFMVGAGAGLSGVKFRAGGPARIGLLIHSGIGAVF